MKIEDIVRLILVLEPENSWIAPGKKVMPISNTSSGHHYQLHQVHTVLSTTPNARGVVASVRLEANGRGAGNTIYSNELVPAGIDLERLKKYQEELKTLSKALEQIGTLEADDDGYIDLRSNSLRIFVEKFEKEQNKKKKIKMLLDQLDNPQLL